MKKYIVSIDGSIGDCQHFERDTLEEVDKLIVNYQYFKSHFHIGVYSLVSEQDTTGHLNKD